MAKVICLFTFIIDRLKKCSRGIFRFRLEKKVMIDFVPKLALLDTKVEKYGDLLSFGKSYW